MARIRINIDDDQVEKIIIDDIIDSFKLIENEIISLYERSKRETLPDHKRADLEDALDHRFHLKQTIKYYTTKSDREERHLHF